MSANSPTIADWIRLKLEWGYIDSALYTKRELAPGESYQLPSKDSTFSYPEIALLHFTAGFDHPSCGLRIEGSPDFDTGNFFTVQNIMLGLTRPEPLVYALVPPTMPLGYYAVRIPSPWIFKDWMRLYALNTDTVPHNLLGHSYHIAALKKPRPDDRIVPLTDMARVQQMLELYPELREPLKRRLAEEAEHFIKDMKLKVKLEAG